MVYHKLSATGGGVIAAIVRRWGPNARHSFSVRTRKGSSGRVSRLVNARRSRLGSLKAMKNASVYRPAPNARDAAGWIRHLDGRFRLVLPRVGTLAMALTMATKENVPLTTAMLGVYMAVVRRMWVPGAVAAIASTVWFLVGTYVVIPAFNVEGQGWLWNRYGGMGGTPLQIVGFLLENPRRFLEPAPGLSNLSYLAKLLFPLGFLSVLDPLALAVGLPALATNLLTVYEPMHMLETYHYTSTLVAVVVVSAIGGARRLSIWARWVAARLGLAGEHWGGLAIAASVALVVTTSLTYHYYRGYTPISPAFAWPRVTEHHAIGREIAALIPPDGVVSAQSNVYPHVSGRDQIWMYPYIGPAEYVFLDVATQPNMVGLNEGFHATLRDTIASPEFGWIAARDGFVLLRRGEPHRELPDEFYSFARVANPRPQAPVQIEFGDSVRLVGFDYRIRRDATVDLDLYWQALRPLTEDLFFPIYLTDRDGRELGATGQPQPANYWYPTSRWRPGETVRIQTINLPFLAGGRSFGLAVGVTAGADPWDVGRRLAPRVTSAPWRTMSLSQGTLVEVIAFANDRGLLSLSTQPRVTAVTPALALDSRVGQSARLAGYDLPTDARAGGQATITLYWQATGSPEGIYTVFVHFVDSQGRLVAQRDAMPLGGRASTNTWLPGDAYADRYAIDLPADLPSGDYRVVIGMYSPATGKRLPTGGQWSTGDAIALPMSVRVSAP